MCMFQGPRSAGRRWATSSLWRGSLDSGPLPAFELRAACIMVSTYLFDVPPYWRDDTGYSKSNDNGLFKMPTRGVNLQNRERGEGIRGIKTGRLERYCGGGTVL